MFQPSPACRINPPKRTSKNLRMKQSMIQVFLLKAFFTLGNLSVEELMHLRLNHPSLPKLVQLNGKVIGLPRKLSNTKQGMFPCHTCQDAKATRNDFPPSSNNWADDPGLWSWDMIDIREDHPTLDNNRYMSIIVIKKSRFGMVFLHSSKDAATNKQVLEKAFAYSGSKPTTLRSDGAGEYKKLNTWLNSIGIWQQITNPDEQHGNGVAEKFGDTIGNGIRTMLKQSNLGTEFWGAAALYFVETRNHLPHSSIENKIPFEERTGKTPTYLGFDHLDVEQLFSEEKITWITIKYHSVVNPEYSLDWELRTDRRHGWYGAHILTAYFHPETLYLTKLSSLYGNLIKESMGSMIMQSLKR